MMEKLERLGRRLLPHLAQGGEQRKSAKGLRWYHKAFVVPVLALTLFAANLVVPSEAQAHSGQWFNQYGTFGWGWCWYAHSDYYDVYYNPDNGQVNEPHGCAYWQRYDYTHGNQYMYLRTQDVSNYYVVWDDGTWAGPISLLDQFCLNYGC